MMFVIGLVLIVIGVASAMYWLAFVGLIAIFLGIRDLYEV